MPRMLPFSSLVLVVAALAGVVPVHGQSVEHRPLPWFVLVCHRIDLAREASRMVSASRAADARLLTGPRYVINLTSGVLVDRDGHVVTRLVNLDPTSSEHDLKITTATGAVLDATFVGLDQPSGLAVLSVPNLRGVEPAPSGGAATFATTDVFRIVTAQQQFPQLKLPVERVAMYPKLVSTPARVVVDVAEPLARGGVVATTESRALSSSTDVSLLERRNGELVGIVIYVGPGRGNVIPLSYVRDVVTDRVVEANGSVQAGWLGAQGQSVCDVPPPQRPNWATDSGVLIQTISAHGPADTAGLKRNDLVVAFDGVAVRSSADLLTCVGTTPAGTKIELGIVREGAPLTLVPVLGGRPLAPGMPTVPVANEEQTLKYQILGLRSQLTGERDPAKRDVIRQELKTLQDRLAALGGPTLDDAVTLGIVAHSLSAQAAAEHGIAGGVEVEKVMAGSAAAGAGLRAADIVVSASGTPLDVVDRLDTAVRRARNSGAGVLVLEVRRNGETIEVRIPVAAAPK